MCVECSYNVCDRGGECIVCPKCRRCTYLEEEILGEIYGYMDETGKSGKMGRYGEGKYGGGKEV